MAVFTNAGTIVSISASIPATFNAAGYGAVTFTAIGQIESLTESGREYTPILFNGIQTRSTVKTKGSYDEGDVSFVIAYDKTDAGMVIAKAGLLSDADYSFKLAFPDGEIKYFQAKVMSLKTGGGSVNDNRMANLNVSITSSATGIGIVEV